MIMSPSCEYYSLSVYSGQDCHEQEAYKELLNVEVSEDPRQIEPMILSLLFLIQAISLICTCM